MGPGDEALALPGLDDVGEDLFEKELRLETILRTSIDSRMRSAALRRGIRFISDGCSAMPDSRGLSYGVPTDPCVDMYFWNAVVTGRWESGREVKLFR